MASMEGESLPGGWMTDARLVDGRVHRPLGPHSDFVHQLLRFLEAVHFEGAPRLVGVADGDEVLTYLDGHVPVETTPVDGSIGTQPISAERDRHRETIRSSRVVVAGRRGEG